MAGERYNTTIKGTATMNEIKGHTRFDLNFEFTLLYFTAEETFYLLQKISDGIQSSERSHW